MTLNKVSCAITNGSGWFFWLFWQGWDDPDVRAVPVRASRPQPVRQAGISHRRGVETATHGPRHTTVRCTASGGMHHVT